MLLEQLIPDVLNAQEEDIEQKLSYTVFLHLKSTVYDDVFMLPLGILA
jgi:hypothetical protein